MTNEATNPHNELVLNTLAVTAKHLLELQRKFNSFEALAKYATSGTTVQVPQSAKEVQDAINELTRSMNGVRSLIQSNLASTFYDGWRRGQVKGQNRGNPQFVYFKVIAPYVLILKQTDAMTVVTGFSLYKPELPLFAKIGGIIQVTPEHVVEVMKGTPIDLGLRTWDDVLKFTETMLGDANLPQTGGPLKPQSSL